MDVRQLARPEIRALSRYETAEQVAETIRLNANEAPWRGSGDNFRRPLNRYPQVRPARLQRLLAEHFGCEARELLVTRGSSEAIDLVFRVFCRAGVDGVITTAPTFSMYEHYAVVQGAQLRQVAGSPTDDFAIRPADVLAACDDRTRLVFLCSPNNPTGALLERDSLVKIIEARRGASVVVVDEAYIEFADQASVSDLVRQYDNLIVLRTLSKALACAGARCGAAIAAPVIIDMLDAVQAPYALATPVIECVEDALDATRLDEARQQVATTVTERERLRAALMQLPWVRRVFPSAANFLLVQVADAKGLMEYTTAQKVLLRYFGGELADCVRISVGSEAENGYLLETLARMEPANG